MDEFLEIVQKQLFPLFSRDTTSYHGLKEKTHCSGASAQQKPQVLAYLRDTDPAVVTQTASDKHNRRNALGVEGPVLELEGCATRFESTEGRTITQYL